jgi:hypothetical protein
MLMLMRLRYGHHCSNSGFRRVWFSRTAAGTPRDRGARKLTVKQLAADLAATPDDRRALRRRQLAEQLSRACDLLALFLCLMLTDHAFALQHGGGVLHALQLAFEFTVVSSIRYHGSRCSVQ